MIQNVLRTMGGIETYGVISICLFFTVFVAALLFAATRKKPFCKSMSALPLSDENPAQPDSSYEK